jgi:hypothetical protein
MSLRQKDPQESFIRLFPDLTSRDDVDWRFFNDCHFVAFLAISLDAYVVTFSQMVKLRRFLAPVLLKCFCFVTDGKSALPANVALSWNSSTVESVSNKNVLRH